MTEDEFDDNESPSLEVSSESDHDDDILLESDVCNVVCIYTHNYSHIPVDSSSVA